MTQKCMSVACVEEGVALVRDGVLLCGRHGLKWIKREIEHDAAAVAA